MSGALVFDFRWRFSSGGLFGLLWVFGRRLFFWSLFLLVGFGLLFAEAIVLKVVGGVVLLYFVVMPVFYIWELRQYAGMMSQGKHPILDRPGYHAEETEDEQASKYPESPPDGDTHTASSRVADSGLVARPEHPQASSQLAFPVNTGYQSVPAAILPTFRRGNQTGHANVVTVVGPMGSSGKTLVACNLAVALIALGKTVVVFDADLQFGDVGPAFGCAPGSFSTLDLTVAGSTAADFKRLFPTPINGLWILPGVSEPSDADAVSVDILARSISKAASMFDVVLVDTAPFLLGATQRSVELSGLVLVLDTGTEQHTQSLLERLAMSQWLDQCLMLRSGHGDRQHSVMGPAERLVSESMCVPAWPVLPRDDSVGIDHPSSLLAIERAPHSPLSREITALAEAVAARLDS